MACTVGGNRSHMVIFIIMAGKRWHTERDTIPERPWGAGSLIGTDFRGLCASPISFDSQ